MHYFITGHTGFKGSWLILLLKQLGHEVSGYSLPPVEGGLFQAAELANDLKYNFYGDIRDFDSLNNSMSVAKPDFAIHMAAQPLVLRSYEDPIETYTTNVDGTLNFLRAITDIDSPRVSLVITTDKVFRDDGRGSYVESDPLGGHDPYSASKAMADILTQSWAMTNEPLKVHIARAGNVIGAFDNSADRLIPDYVRAYKAGNILSVRHLQAVRPWQHVLDCLFGYIKFLNFANEQKKAPLVLNFGPDKENTRTVQEVLAVANSMFQVSINSRNESLILRKETRLLSLDTSLAKSVLGWDNRLDFHTAIKWSLAELDAVDARELAETQIREFLCL